MCVGGIDIAFGGARRERGMHKYNGRQKGFCRRVCDDKPYLRLMVSHMDALFAVC